MKKISPAKLRKAQLIMLDGLIWFDNICRNHCLRYWLDSGTLLGAKRHGGFIPWDDDIDISMPIEDYRKFIEIARHEPQDGIFVQTSASDPDFSFDYMKIRSDRATIVELHELGKDISYHQGVFIDIFPMLSVKDTKIHSLFYRFSFTIIRFFSAKHYQNKTIRSFFVRALHRLHMGWEQKNSKIIYGGEMPDVAADFDYDSIFPLQKMKFEDRSFFAPCNSNDYLEQLYSFDFMEMPPENKRTIHAADIVINRAVGE